MSFLNSVIGSIGNNGQTRPSQQPEGAQSRNGLSGEAASAGGNGSSNVDANPTPPILKRKAEDDLPRINDKLSKLSSYRGTSATTSPYTTSKEARPAKIPPNPQSNALRQSLPNRSANNTPSSATSVAVAPKAPQQDAAKAPKKGSFAEIMARAKSGEEAPQAIGVIKHQAKDKKALSTKKELLLQKRSQLGKTTARAPNGHSRNSSADVSSGSGSKLPGKNGTVSGKKGSEMASKSKSQKPVRPPPAYRGTMGLGRPAAAARPQKPLSRPPNGRSNGPPRRQEYYSEDEESEMEEDEGGYSDESDDMEAGFDDVEHEETTATKIARKEDEEEARMEAEMKRQKEARKKRLQDLAKKQGAKKPIY